MIIGDNVLAPLFGVGQNIASGPGQHKVFPFFYPPIFTTVTDHDFTIELIEAGLGLPKPELRQDTGIAAGLRVRLGAACLDATLEGLSAKLHAVEARLLAAWERQQPGGREHAND